ncbi:hypothetical protein [Delftia sp. PS-11]|uniref:hypothetical protein n=1 Tax=Delftia sp. PS-11 TaxID=2767222 RepID=UPI002454B350|nr:hypothetical protein [Delftia sp. PS-11]KAJ8745968.1 hypothetical protein H9T68_04760 [Delftia sp. PS-11]
MESPDFPVAPVNAADAAAAQLALDLWLLRGEAMGWQPLGQGGYWHGPVPQAPKAGDTADAVPVVHVVGCPDPEMAGLSVLLLT